MSELDNSKTFFNINFIDFNKIDKKLNNMMKQLSQLRK